MKLKQKNKSSNLSYWDNAIRVTGAMLGAAAGSVGGVWVANEVAAETGSEIVPALLVVVVMGLGFGAGLTAAAAIAKLRMTLNKWINYNVKVKVEKIDKAHNLKKPPFSFLLKIAKILPARYAANLEQEVSDLRIEYNEALVGKNFWRARCIIFFYYTGIGWSVVKWIAERAKELAGFMPKVN